METLPFWRMQPRNELVIEGQAFCLAQLGEEYAFYLPEGGDIQVQLTEGARYEVAWWSPDNGRHGSFSRKSTCAGGRRHFRSPSDSDWALRIVRQE